MTQTLMFRLIFAVIFLTAFAVATVHRTTAQIKGGSVSESSENRILYILLRGGGIALWLSFFLYIFYPRALAWSVLPLPTAVRWIGVGIATLAVPLAAWAAYTIGGNVTRTVITRENHELITSGPYRYIRHPLYTFGMLLFIGLGLISASGFMLGMTLLALVLILLRLPQEEAGLVEHFGDRYRAYRQSTGALLPRIG